jgi:hypothetical protein
MIAIARTGVLRFFFAPTSALPLAVLRIVTGAISSVWSALLYTDLDPLLTYLRVEPDREILWWQLFPNLSLLGLRTFCFALVLASLLLMVGAWTRMAAWSVFGLTLILQRYNPAAFNGGDLILRGVVQLGVALGPAGAAISIDALRRQDRRRPVPQIEAWSLRFIQLHISIGYLLTFYLKTRGHTWFDGTALWYALNLEDLARFEVPDLLLAPPVGAILTWLAVGTEALVGIGVWLPRTRALALVAGIALHAGIALTMEIGFFSLVMVSSYLAFVPGSALEDLMRRLRQKPASVEARDIAALVP